MVTCSSAALIDKALVVFSAVPVFAAPQEKTTMVAKSSAKAGSLHQYHAGA